MLSDKITVRGQTLLAFSLFILCCLFVCGGAAFADGDQLSGTISKPATQGADTPVAGFAADVTTGFSKLTVNFTDQSTGNITSRLWDFGDGKTSPGTNPTHTYYGPGDYTVKLSVTGPEAPIP